ncbi:cyclic nucleotide-binding protein [Flavobacterium rivuli WB 3.3-2 = DSM 21788]|uniref:Cyclic nucleotide-binding protein n=1 Tax=Flavobacterium rivuli WB 3.3-2 = DSM 21788 TaxID=1121895 RepID=A0A0A2M5Q9_9FLAO|nr:Crp/Fnr family transcriptional regulator [Flavobacterium rivuli]KGO86768.1 cyclic nucleotide-binding protein [Flavobacterium rivuli WB 3.3-2 = DSM 21788]
MHEKLINHINTLLTADAGLATAAPDYFKEIKLKKKEVLLQEGQTCNYNYFVVKGCLRLYYINNKGVEHTTQFALENWWLSDYIAFQTGQPASFYIQAVENSEILAIDHKSLEKLYKLFPCVESYFRVIYQKAYAASQLKAKYFNDYSKEELYNHFSKAYPMFINRLPQYLIASFLGFTPEYLSEIRKRSVS